MTNFEVGEKVLYLSSYNHQWRTGNIKRFSQDGMRNVAIIEDEHGVDKIPLVLDTFIKKYSSINAVDEK